MTKFFAAAALIATLAAPVVASAKDAAQSSFTRDGETYFYTAAVKGDATILSGRSSSGSHFRLVVRAGRVNGQSGGVPVSFDVAETRTSGVALASR